MTWDRIHKLSKFTNVMWVSQEKDIFIPVVGFGNVRNFRNL